jgi:4-amino-4-deoxy-L-arabinose transferase-like glycosyltransferase
LKRQGLHSKQVFFFVGTCRLTSLDDTSQRGGTGLFVTTPHPHARVVGFPLPSLAQEIFVFYIFIYLRCSMESFSYRVLAIFSTIAAVLVYFTNSGLDIMEIDAAQYARMGWVMWETKSFLHLYDQGVPYLDKPHLIFWLSSLSFGLFGMNNFAFKFPALVFALLGIYSTYRFASCWYDKKIAYCSAAIIALSQGFFHFTNDVRTDVFLCNALAASLWMFSEQWLKPKSHWWVGAYFFAAVAMLAKGPIGFLVPVIAFGAQAVLTRQFLFWINWRTSAGLLLTLLVLSPALYGLYTQFDLHPEQLVNERTNVSGIRFFLWEQSFGRLTGESVWNNDTGPFFFVHTLAWSFLPWTLLLPAVFLVPFWSGVRREWISSFAFVIPFLAISMSNYKLPHYVYVVMSPLAVLCAVWLSQMGGRLSSALFKIQLITLLLLFSIALLLTGYAFPVNKLLLSVYALLFGMLLFYMLRIKAIDSKFSFIAFSAGTAILLNILISLHLYPNILKYQSGAYAGRDIQHIRRSQTASLFGTEVSRSLEFYAGETVRQIKPAEISNHCIPGSSCYVFTNSEGKEILSSIDGATIVAAYPHFRVTKLTPGFFIPEKRSEIISMRYLVEYESAN